MDEERKRKKLNPLEVLGRYKYVLLVAALGALLLAWPERGAPGGGETEPPDVSAGDGRESLEETERALEGILGKMEGVGRVEVMLTLQSGRELVLAGDDSLRYSGNVNSPDSYDRSTATVTVNSSGGEDVVVTQEKYPQYRGALVVCDGGSSDAVRLAVTGAVSALTGLGSDRIAVVRWQSGGGAE